jgi:hypothetical protein
VSEQDQDPDDESIEREAGVSLPERDAMSVLRIGTILPMPPEVAPGEVAAPGSGPADIAPEPAPPIDKIDPQPLVE